VFPAVTAFLCEQLYSALRPHASLQRNILHLDPQILAFTVREASIARLLFKMAEETKVLDCYQFCNYHASVGVLFSITLLSTLINFNSVDVFELINFILHFCIETLNYKMYIMGCRTAIKQITELLKVSYLRYTLFY
jgi:hypothetical protein